jgi:aspartate carbamoyltransferase catalytic subunit
MKTMGMNVKLIGPPTMIPLEIEKMGVSVGYYLEDAIPNADVIMILRLQKERQSKYLLSSIREYSNLYCLTSKFLEKAKDDVLIFHPGPINRGIEISLDVMQSDRSLILNQVTNGVALRMALMYLVLGGNNDRTN